MLSAAKTNEESMHILISPYLKLTYIESYLCLRTGVFTRDVEAA